MLGLLNGGAQVIRAYRYVVLNTGVAAVTAALTLVQIRRLTALSAGTAVTPVKHDTGSGALSSVTCVHGGTATGSDIFRRFLYLLEEATTTGVTQANWEVLIPVGIVFFPTGGDAALEPIVCRNTYGTDIYNAGAGAVSTNDFEITFTDAAT
jgi:hypothetical protein